MMLSLMHTIAVIILPFLTLPHFVPAQQLWTRECATSAVDLCLSPYSLEATILFALLIYKMQKNDVEKEQKTSCVCKSCHGNCLGEYTIFDGEEYEKYLQAGKELAPTMMFEYEIEYEGMDRLFMVNLQVENDEEWIIRKESLEEYLEKTKCCKKV